MSRRILFYVTGHGYGHARRCAQVIRALNEIDAGAAVHVRTTAKPWLFGGVVPPERVQPCDVDAGAAERSPMEVDPDGTLSRIAATLARRDATLATELPVLRAMKPDLIVADIPFLAGDVAEAAGVPCVGLSNFTWDWIVEPFVATRPEHQPLLAAMTAGYGKMAGILRLPIGGISPAFGNVVEMPLVVNRPRLDRQEVVRRLGIAPDDRRPRVLFGIRGSIPMETLAAAAAAAPDLRFVCPTDDGRDVPPGVVPAPVGPNLDFADVLRACDVVVGKMGYGLVAECIAAGTALLWPRRTGFREDEITEREGPAVLRMRELPTADFHAGRWAEHARAAAALPKPEKSMRTDGAEACARWIADHVS